MAVVTAVKVTKNGLVKFCLKLNPTLNDLWVPLKIQRNQNKGTKLFSFALLKRVAMPSSPSPSADAPGEGGAGGKGAAHPRRHPETTFDV